MLSRNKVAVPEGAAGTPPFWRSCLRADWKRKLNNQTVLNRDYLLLVIHFFYLKLSQNEPGGALKPLRRGEVKSDKLGVRKLGFITYNL